MPTPLILNLIKESYRIYSGDSLLRLSKMWSLSEVVASVKGLSTHIPSSIRFRLLITYEKGNCFLAKQLQVYTIYTNNTTNDLGKTIALLDTYVEGMTPLILTHYKIHKYNRNHVV